jgi:hypothetical protein
MEAFSRNAARRMQAIGVGTDRELFHMLKQKFRAEEITEKTVNNAVKARHNAKIGTLNAIAETLGLPLWVLMIPDLPEEFLRDQDAQRLVRLVQGYLESDGEGRAHIENIAAAAAYRSNHKA